MPEVVFAEWIISDLAAAVVLGVVLGILLGALALIGSVARGGGD